jgi:Protein of unknown function (DUF1580)
MIDLETERVLPLTAAAKCLPRLRGKRIHCSTLYRWANRGVRGIVLETARIGGSTVTSAEAIRRFVDSLSRPPAPRTPPPAPGRVPPAINKALDRIGL